MTTFEPPLRLMDVRQVAATLGCSVRHVYRLSDAGRMPCPLKLGTLNRWSKPAIDQWLAEGCKAVKVSPASRRSTR